MKNAPLLIVIVLVIVVVGFLFYRSQSGTSYMGYGGSPTQIPSQTSAPTAMTTTNPTPASGGIVMTRTDPAKGDYLAGPNGMTLYVFDKDTTGVSNCTGACATLWPPYTTSAVPATLPANVTTLTRSDGTIQFAYNGKSIYYYTPDKQPGDTTGDGVGGIWHIIKP